MKPKHRRRFPSPPGKEVASSCPSIPRRDGQDRTPQGMVRGVGTPRTWNRSGTAFGIVTPDVVSMSLLLEGKAVQDQCLDGMVDEVSVRYRGRLHLEERAWRPA